MLLLSSSLSSSSLSHSARRKMRAGGSPEARARRQIWRRARSPERSHARNNERKQCLADAYKRLACAAAFACDSLRRWECHTHTHTHRRARPGEAAAATATRLKWPAPFERSGFIEPLRLMSSFVVDSAAAAATRAMAPQRAAAAAAESCARAIMRPIHVCGGGGGAARVRPKSAAPSAR